ncbi:hypothetical protein JV173_04340 [Acholeplasma equirhinis]|uniref:hypothetical protein n=1 Tax=Acholeplasma equirhinis TaxID=555393 RepID=UPI00197AE2B6|nr:hypothetical protein [Acholeplasma equirhinis]MBN3490739.1 hypothetical protein [Acholeplasma equirhinis]
MKKLFSLFAVALAAFVLVACDQPAPFEPDFSQQVELNVAINYSTSGQLYSISYQRESTYSPVMKPGKTYTKGSLLPVWEKIGELTNTTFVDKATSNHTSTADQFEKMQAEGFEGIDLINGTGALIGDAGVNGSFVDLGKYLDKMPNLSAFFDANPAVKQSLTSGDGGIYFTPYFDGINELEHMFMVRVDWVKDILDAANTDAFDTDDYVMGINYQPVTPATASYNVTVANPDASTRVVAKTRTSNVINLLRATLEKKDEVMVTNGKKLADTFRSYINQTYGSGHGYTKLSDIFVGTDASYDTDELVALMYVIDANPKYILRQVQNNSVKSIEMYFPREKSGARVRQMFRGLEMFGLRGASSRNEWMYIDEDGQINDVRAGKDVDKFIDSVNNLSNLVTDGLIPNVEGFTTTNLRQELLTGDGDYGRFGFMTYDYNASSTTTGLIEQGGKLKDPDMEFQAILPPVVDWLGDGKYFHFSESNRSVKNEAWGIPMSIMDKDEAVLLRALAIVDGMYDYSEADSIGNIHLYGPQEWRSGTILDYNGEQVYQLHQTQVLGPNGEINTLAAGNHINYLRWYMGATMPIGHVRSLGLEYQTLTEDGIKGIERINTAVQAGVLKLAGHQNAASLGKWGELVPTFLPYTQLEITARQNSTFRDHTADGKLLALMINGFSGNNNGISAADYKALLATENYQTSYLAAVRAAFARSKGE